MTLPTRIIEVTVTRAVRQEEKPCPVCRARFWSTPQKRYCSRTCQNKAHYRRHVEEYRQRRRG